MSSILITGASGFLGSILSQKLSAEGHQITVFTRNSAKASRKLPENFRFFNWDYHNPEMWKKELNKHDVVIHLAGANLFGKRWTENYKKVIVESRETSTKLIAGSIDKENTAVKLLIVASAIGYYGDTGTTVVDENSPAGNDFLANICKIWEESSFTADEKNVRRVNLRMGLLFSTREGYLNRVLIPFRLFIGGALGSRKNYISWVHIDDVINSFVFAIKNQDLRGPVNVTSPNNLTMGEFTSALGKVMKRPSFYKAPAPLLKIFVGEGARYITYSQRVFPRKLIENGFKFSYPELETALKDLLKNKK